MGLAGTRDRAVRVLPLSPPRERLPNKGVRDAQQLVRDLGSPVACPERLALLGGSQADEGVIGGATGYARSRQPSGKPRGKTRLGIQDQLRWEPGVQQLGSDLGAQAGRARQAGQDGV